MAGSPLATADVFHRTLMARDLGRDGLTRALDCVQTPDGRVFTTFGTGTSPAAFLPDGASGCATPLELREISGGAMVVTDGPGPLALSNGARLDLSPIPAEPELFAGLNTIFGFRIDETATQVAEGLIYHALHHGLHAALIVNRLPDGADFARALRKALGKTRLTVVVLDSPIPLGKPDEGPVNHPWFAPDAPGKDRMEAPAPDPWRSALSEQILFEALKWRFLSQARAVLTLDVTDILAPDAPNPFDQCQMAKHGVILLVGRRIYPWRVRPKGEPRFGDHICRQFDARRGIARWGVAPAKAGLENTWRMVRVAFAKPDTAQAVPFLRAMSIRVPGRQAGELAPKTSLIEDPGLLAMAETYFAHKPVRAPTSTPRAAPQAAAKAGRTAIVTTMKNEGPFILEWIAYHRAIGVDDFLVYTNDCTDGTDTMLELLQAKGLCQHRVNPWVPGGELKPQHAALQAAESEPVMQNCGWGICMDVDEFINIK
ncbi:glycosyltransferase family 2 protein, partial [Pseudotabrizicola sp.]|uniref:glycosyltransferase family 2 protein n=1 Tax=Pseudotabrizicola sp. TaxID=2939647 RepID=UPI002723045A